jgi:predicted RNase H-like HicB family nuclease
MPTCRFTMEYWRDGSWYVGRLREVPGVFSQGKTLAELDENLRDAYRLVLKGQQPIRRRGVRRKALAFAVKFSCGGLSTSGQGFNGPRLIASATDDSANGFVGGRGHRI